MASWLRTVGMALAGLLLAAVGLAWFPVLNQIEVSHRHARPCDNSATPPVISDCTAHEPGAVVERNSMAGEDHDAWVRVERASGKRDKYDVNGDFFRVAPAGTPVVLSVWNGDVVELSAAGETSPISSDRTSWATVGMFALIGLGTYLLVYSLGDRFGNVRLVMAGLVPFAALAVEFEVDSGGDATPLRSVAIGASVWCACVVAAILAVFALAYRERQQQKS
ncbi:hypothetical protein [Kitasatospora sp. KL5]|uniref:hypothetical protein n=1 Tax=Kitasatospora sp. KL5 TaxID=3425125 RepID=UPI003D6DEA1F